MNGRDVIALRRVRPRSKDQSAPGSFGRLGNFLTGRSSRRTLSFPLLAMDPDKLYGVLLLCDSRPDPVTVNGRRVEVEKRGPGRFLLPASAFTLHENVVATPARAGEIDLAPVVAADSPEASRPLPGGRPWRAETLEGALVSELGISRTKPAAKPDNRSAALARALTEFIVGQGPHAGDVWSFFDLEEGGFRLSQWRWDSAIVLEALAAAAKAFDDPALYRAAETVGDRFIEVGLETPDCPGGTPEWTDLRFSEDKETVTQWVAPFNEGFVAAGLARLYQVAFDERFMKAALRSASLAAARGLTAEGGLYGYYFLESEKWRYLGQINDSGVMPRGLAAAAITGDPAHARAAHAAMRFIGERAGADDGSYLRAWRYVRGAARPGPPLFPEWKRRPDRVVPKIFLRGQAWVMLGLCGALRLGEAPDLLERARKLAGFLQEAQTPEGGWLYSGKQPEMGLCVKGTAAISLALAEYAATTGDRTPLPSVRRALEFLESSSLAPEAPEALAVLPVDRSTEGCIIYYRDRPVICAYAGALELLARLELARLEGGAP